MPDHRTSRRDYRRVVALVVSVAFLLAAAGGLAAAPAASGAPLPLLLCQGTETFTYQPPLTNTPALTEVNAGIDLNRCHLGRVASGQSQYSITATLSCTGAGLLPPAFSDTYQWSNGTSSTVTYTASVTTPVNGTVIITDTGTVTSGYDQGAAANATTTVPELNLTACAGTGVAQQTGSYALALG